MKASRKKWILMVGLAVSLAVALVSVVTYVDWREGQRFSAALRREAHGPWPKDRVGQAMIVSFRPSADLSAIEEELAVVLVKQNVGYFDGSECSRTRCTMFMYGPDAAALLEVARPVLRQGGAGLASVDLRLGPGGGDPLAIRRVKL
jgi:hypothetical protein